MKEVFVNNSLNYLKNNNACSEKQENIFRYTLESLYSMITKTSVVLLLSLVLGTFKITLISLILYSILRGFAFGIHATKNIYCWITTLSIYLIFPFIIKYMVFRTEVLYILDAIGFLAILLWAPADTPARPLFDKKKRIVNKFISAIIACLLFALSLVIKNQDFSEIVSFILLLNAICICPLTYKLFHIPYSNYKKYNQ